MRSSASWSRIGAQPNEEWARSIKAWAKAPEDWAKATKEIAASIATQTVKEYKDLDALMFDATVAMVGIYIVDFDDCKPKVIEAYVGIDLHCITPTGGSKDEEEDESARKVE